MRTPAPTLLHRLFRMPPGRFPRWLLSKSSGRLDAVTFAIQAFLLIPIAIYVILQHEYLFTVTSLFVGVLYLAVAFVIDAFLDAVLIAPARRMERIAQRAERRRMRLASPLRRGRAAIKEH